MNFEIEELTYEIAKCPICKYTLQTIINNSKVSWTCNCGIKHEQQNICRYSNNAILPECNPKGTSEIAKQNCISRITKMGQNILGSMRSKPNLPYEPWRRRAKDAIKQRRNQRKNTTFPENSGNFEGHSPSY